MRVKLLFFATLRELAGTKSIEIEIPGDANVKTLKARVSQDYPSLNQSMETVLVSINHEFSFDDELVPGNAEIALFPPVSGGES